MRASASIIDPERRIGTVTRLTASTAEATMPHSLATSGRRGMARGTVGDFVFLDCDHNAVLGRITEVAVLAGVNGALDNQLQQSPIVYPTGRVQLLATVNKGTLKVTRGLSTQPRIGDAIYLADSATLSATIQDALVGDLINPILIELGHLSGLEDTSIHIPPEKLFGRHCGIFGATGGGKSWTVSRLLNQAVAHGGKCILFDPTGEFSGKVPGAQEFSFTKADAGQLLARFPFNNLSEEDLRALLTPTGQSQIPTLRNAVKSLRLSQRLAAGIDGFTVTMDGDKKSYDIFIDGRSWGNIRVEGNHAIHKAGAPRVAIGKAEILFAADIGSDLCNFNIHALAAQIKNECIHPTGDNLANYGGVDRAVLGYCSSLIVRTETLLSAPELGCLFSDRGEDICSAIQSFINDDQCHALIISFKNVTFKYNTRELLLNALGRYLLRLARQDTFRHSPLICFLDEAHQFIGRSVGDEANRVTLDSFGLIAKEGRKFGLTVVIATQRPRDVPQDVLSQMGTLIVHRLTNEADRDTIEKACGDLDRSAAAFIPALVQGEAIVVGPDLPAPMPILMSLPKPGQRPSSKGPDYQTAWNNRKNT